jgi:hypothetical protein
MILRVAPRWVCAWGGHLRQILVDQPVHFSVGLVQVFQLCMFTVQRIGHLCGADVVEVVENVVDRDQAFSPMGQGAEGEDCGQDEEGHQQDQWGKAKQSFRRTGRFFISDFLGHSNGRISLARNFLVWLGGSCDWRTKNRY